MCRIWYLFSIFALGFGLLASGCAADSGQNEIIANPPKSSSTVEIAEYKVIELFADISASPTALEGVWESSCNAYSSSSFYKNRRVFHLNGFFREVAQYNDKNCNIRNSRNTPRFFGTINSIETIRQIDGNITVEVKNISSDLMIAPTTGRLIPVENLTLDDLSPYFSTIETFSIYENRLYISDNANPTLDELFIANNDYLINAAIDIKEKTPIQIDQEIEDLKVANSEF